MTGGSAEPPAGRLSEVYKANETGAPPPSLSENHRRMLLEESAIDPEIVAERGYRTVRSRAELLEFKKYQRRAPALYVPMYSPDRTTISAQIRPDNPRRDKSGKPIKYETAGGARVILDVHPRNMEAVQDPAVDLWITEGVKKGDALTSRGECAISLIGVWNWQRDGDLLSCWEHVALKERRVFVVFDSDVMVKEGVQLAVERLVGDLEAHCADVRVV